MAKFSAEELQKIQKELDALYEGVDPMARNQNDKWLLTVERRTMSLKESWKDPDLRKRQSELAKQAHQNPETKKRRKESRQKPEVKARKSEGQKLSNRDPEVKARRSNAGKLVAQRPEWKERREKTNQDPEVKARRRESHLLSRQNPEWIRKNCRPFKCPYGIFQRQVDAIPFVQPILGKSEERVKKTIHFFFCL
jgi:hypothetical protein